MSSNVDLTSEQFREFNDTELTPEPVSPNVLYPNVGHSSADGFGIAQNAEEGEVADVNEVAPGVENSDQREVPVQSDIDDAETGENFDEEAPKVDRSNRENSFFAFFRREMHTPNFRMTIHVTIQALYLALLLLMIWNPTEEKIAMDAKKSLFLHRIVLVVTAIFLIEGTLDFIMDPGAY